MTQERINAIAEMLNADEVLTKKLIEMDADQAAEAMKAEGFDVTADELIEFNKLMTEVVKAEELEEESLDEVAGGCHRPPCPWFPRPCPPRPYPPRPRPPYPGWYPWY